MLDDPNSLLRDIVTKQNIVSTTTLFISTAPPPPAGLFGGGTDNIAFLLGQAAANCTQRSDHADDGGLLD